MGLGAAASAAGGLMTRNSALNNAQSQAAARNGVLSNTINGLDSIYNKTNAPAFSSAVDAVTPGGLQTAQDARVANNVGNITKPDINGPTGGDAPPAVGNAYKSDLADAFNFATNEATASGKLGGYGDQWFNSGLARQDAARKIGIGNSNAENLKSLLEPEQDIAGVEAYKPPSTLGQVFSGVGNMLGSYSGPRGSPNGAHSRSAPAACSRRRHLRCSVTDPSAARWHKRITSAAKYAPTCAGPWRRWCRRSVNPRARGRAPTVAMRTTVIQGEPTRTWETRSCSTVMLMTR
jgi:hypothetical protein